MSCLLCIRVQVKVVPEEVLQEIHIMKHLSHPQLVKLHEIIDDDTCKYLYLVMEYVEVTTSLLCCVQWQQRLRCVHAGWSHYDIRPDLAAICVQADEWSPPGGHGQQDIQVRWGGVVYAIRNSSRQPI